MARTRSIKPEFKDDEKLAKCSRDSRLTFVIMWGLCDDYGVCRSHSGWLNSNIFPYDNVPIKTFEKWILELEQQGALIPFEAEEEHYYFLPNFLKHQKIDHPSKTRNPEPPDDILDRLATDSRDNREGSRKTPPQTETETETETCPAKPDGVPYQDIIDDFNHIFATSYKSNSKKTRELIRARMKEGFTLEDFKKVHRNMNIRWSNDPKMNQFLRPQTLYSGNFESYLNKVEPIGRW